MGRFATMRSRRNQIKNRGFDYSGRMLLRSTDPNLYKNDNIRGFAVKIEAILNEWWLQAKRIKTFYNFAVPADSDDIN